MSEDDRVFWLAARQALLMLLDAVERRLKISPRTAELRKNGGILSAHVRHDKMTVTLTEISEM